MPDPFVDLTDHVAQAEYHHLVPVQFCVQIIKAGVDSVKAFVHRRQVFTNKSKLFQHDIVGLVVHPQPPIAQRAQKPPMTSNLARKAISTTQPNEKGRKTFQPMRISWS